MDTTNRPESETGPGRSGESVVNAGIGTQPWIRSGHRFRHRVGGVFLALFFAFAPSTVPDWRADPATRTVMVLAIGEPVARFDRSVRR